MGHLHLPHLPLHISVITKKESAAAARDPVQVPKGCLAIKVGQEGEQQQRFVVPVVYFNHPLFLRLLEEAEREYGFEQKGTITIPCHVAEFRNVQGLIDRDNNSHNHHGHGHNHNHLVGCFKA